MRKSLSFITIVFLFASCASQRPAAVADNDVERIIRTLSADDMGGRALYTPGIEKAGAFIENEFRQIGLKPLSGEKGFRQEFGTTRIKPAVSEVTLDGNVIDPAKVMVITDMPGLNWNSDPDVQAIEVKAGESFFAKYRSIMAMKKKVIVYVDMTYADAFTRIRTRMQDARTVANIDEKTQAVFVLAPVAKSFRVNFTNVIEKANLFNVAGVLPGKSKATELVVFSAHYDHLGVIKPVDGDSIANGADDDASGVTAVISLAKYYKALGNNQRTLIFVAFTGEESGGFGSHHFSDKVNADSVVAMFNIEMIGKESKFGKNAAFITGMERSDFGKILQKNLEGTAFKFYQDPYPEQQLFYRSDNATLAALGVPAHSISTDQIDKDKLYHSVNDEFESLDVANIVATIRAIALSSRSIVAGIDTPSRIPKLDKK